MEQKLQKRLKALQDALDLGESLLQLLTENVEREKSNLQTSFDLNIKKLDQYTKMKCVLIEAALSEISADTFRTESLLTDVDIVSETQQISDRPVPAVEVSVDDLPVFASARELSIIKALSGKDAEISDLKAEISRLSLLALAPKEKLTKVSDETKEGETSQITQAVREMFSDCPGPLSRVEFFTQLHLRGFAVAVVEKFMLKLTDENGDVWVNRILVLCHFVNSKCNRLLRVVFLKTVTRYIVTPDRQRVPVIKVKQGKEPGEYTRYSVYTRIYVACT
jgi:hypothetical protein